VGCRRCVGGGHPRAVLRPALGARRDAACRATNSSGGPPRRLQTRACSLGDRDHWVQADARGLPRARRAWILLAALCRHGRRPPWIRAPGAHCALPDSWRQLRRVCRLLRPRAHLPRVADAAGANRPPCSSTCAPPLPICMRHPPSSTRCARTYHPARMHLGVAVPSPPCSTRAARMHLGVTVPSPPRSTRAARMHLGVAVPSPPCSTLAARRTPPPSRLSAAQRTPLGCSPSSSRSHCSSSSRRSPSGRPSCATRVRSSSSSRVPRRRCLRCHHPHVGTSSSRITVSSPPPSSPLPPSQACLHTAWPPADYTCGAT
jgi:hypothetical protein